MSRTRTILVTCFLLVCACPLSAMNDLTSLKDWVRKYPLVSGSKPRRGIYTSPALRPKLLRLLGAKSYKRLVNDYYVMSQIEFIDGYLIAQMCEQHACPASSSFMAVNLGSGDIHVAFFREGHVEWFHTMGKAKDLPYNVLHKPWWMRAPVWSRGLTKLPRTQHNERMSE